MRWEMPGISDLRYKGWVVRARGESLATLPHLRHYNINTEQGSGERSINYSYHSDNANTSQNNNYTHNIPGDLCCKYGDFYRTPIHNWQFVRTKFFLVLEFWCGQSNENVNVWILWCSALPSSGMTRLSAIIPVTPGRWWYLCKHSPRVSYFRVYTNCPGNGGGDTLSHRPQSGCQVFKWR